MRWDKKKYLSINILSYNNNFHIESYIKVFSVVWNKKKMILVQYRPDCSTNTQVFYDSI